MGRHIRTVLFHTLQLVLLVKGNNALGLDTTPGLLHSVGNLQTPDGQSLRRPSVLRSCPLSGAVAPSTSSHLLDWPPSLNLPASPHVPEVGPPSNKGESLSPWSTSAPGKLMAQWLASDLPISPHLGWLQPSSDRHNFMLLEQQVCRSCLCVMPNT